MSFEQGVYQIEVQLGVSQKFIQMSVASYLRSCPLPNSCLKGIAQELFTSNVDYFMLIF